MKSADTLESNFDEMLLGLMSEVHSCSGSRGIPSVRSSRRDAGGGSAQSAKYHARRVRLQSDFDAAGADERQLFGEHIRRLDRRECWNEQITWASKSVIEWYVTDCRKRCTNTRKLVLQFKGTDKNSRNLQADTHHRHQNTSLRQKQSINTLP